MIYYELKIACLLKKNLYYTETNEFIGNKINKSMLLDDDLKKEHKKNEYKMYCFNSFFPIEKDKTYSSGKVYMFKLRSLDKLFIDKIKICLKKLKDNDIDILAIEKRKVNMNDFKEFHTITPVIVTVDNKPWIKENGDLEVFISRLQNNLIKKYKKFFNEELELEEYFIEKFTMGKKPLACKYKGKSMLGYKIKFKINDDEVSKKLAYIALAAGLGEKNSSLGAGFCCIKG
ncbi:CRISPR-associated endoribonuclease Cas6 [Tepidibacter sp. Z1-5]|uniref:CRISPR-associated endoribonuclease Cas6 n=1 Tax=Tepidibacter sp. Z1-5 TaxID=3134138 RepID=UPI0030C12BC5